MQLLLWMIWWLQIPLPLWCILWERNKIIFIYSFKSAKFLNGSMLLFAFAFFFFLFFLKSLNFCHVSYLFKKESECFSFSLLVPLPHLSFMSSPSHVTFLLPDSYSHSSSLLLLVLDYIYKSNGMNLSKTHKQ